MKTGRAGRATLIVATTLTLSFALGLGGCAPYPPADPDASGGRYPTNPSEDAYADFTLPVPRDVYTQWTSPDRSNFSLIDTQVPGYANPPTGFGYGRYFDQSVTWIKCGGYECANVLAPLDWQDPNGQAITLAMKRRPATKTPVLGSLFINPGGPGASAKDYVNDFSQTGLEQYNIVGLDPRGSGDSTGVVCGTTAQTDAFFDLDQSPDSDAEKSLLISGAREFAAQCRAGSGRLLDHISTIETVYDFDMVRQLLGDEKFNFYGGSYGTFIGAVYAELYPEHTGYLVLDGAVNITDKVSVSQSDGFELALHKWAQWCAGPPQADPASPTPTTPAPATPGTASGCTLGSTEEAVIATLTQFVADLDQNPIKVGDRTLTQSLAVAGIGLYFYLGADVYKQLTQVIEYTIATRDGKKLLDAADLLDSRGDSGWEQMAFSFPAIACLDNADEGLDASFADWQVNAARAPFFGRYLGADVTCVVWGARPAPQIKFTGAGAAPLVVIGGTGDNATPYQYAQWMAETLESAVLVTRNGVGHGSYDSGSSCIDKIVRNFLVNGVVPDNGTLCQMD
jgi:pimeloyl-ACP methyl ester carboxylesterase